MPTSIQNLYGNKVRIRVCGICVVSDQLLLINHHGLRAKDFWSPPGGGIELGETMQGGLEREFLEETNLSVRCKDFLFIAEFIELPIHAVELFFSVEYQGGDLKTGHDPEMNADAQIIKESRFHQWSDIAKMDKNELHGIFKYVPEPAKILDLRGYFKL